MVAMKIAQIASLASLDVMCLNGRSSLQLTFDGPMLGLSCVV